MPSKYRVRVYAEATIGVWDDVEVEATSPEEARELAMAITPGTLMWDTCGPFSEVGDITEADEPELIESEDDDE